MKAWLAHISLDPGFCHHFLLTLQMFRVSALLAILASAAAFAPMGRVATNSALKMSFSSELGAQAPLGFWDPLNILESSANACRKLSATRKLGEQGVAYW